MTFDSFEEYQAKARQVWAEKSKNVEYWQAKLPADKMEARMSHFQNIRERVQRAKDDRKRAMDRVDQAWSFALARRGNVVGG